MNFRMLMEKKKTQFLSYIFVSFSIFFTGMKEANKGLDWLISFIDTMYVYIFPVMQYWLNIVLCINVVFFMVCMKMH